MKFNDFAKLMWALNGGGIGDEYEVKVVSSDEMGTQLAYIELNFAQKRIFIGGE